MCQENHSAHCGHSGVLASCPVILSIFFNMQTPSLCSPCPPWFIVLQRSPDNNKWDEVIWLAGANFLCIGIAIAG